MKNPALLVLSNPDDKYLAMLDAIRDRARIQIAPDAAGLEPFAADADALLAWGPKKGELQKILPKTPKLQWIHLRWAGLDAIMTPELAQSPATLTNAKGVYSQSLGDFALLACLYFAKEVARLNDLKRLKKWEAFTVQELRGATMGIAGYGDIGKACASRAKAMGMRVLATRRRPELSHEDPLIDQVFGRDSLLDMLSQSDYVVAAAPLTPDTRHMLSTAQFKAMKPTAVVINIGRGPVVDEMALIQALADGIVKGAALDVFEVEPLPTESPLWDMPNVLISPHCTDNTPTWHEDSMRFFLKNFDHFERGEALENVVDKNAGY